MISSVAWVPKGAAKKNPDVAEITEEELAALRAAGEPTVDDIDEDEQSDSDDAMSNSSDEEELDEAAAVAKAKAFAAAIKSTAGGASGAPAPGNDRLAAAMAELDMDHYDDTDEEDGAVTRILGASNNPGLAYYKNPELDPILKHTGGDDDSDSDSEADALNLRDDDLLIVAARNEDDVSHLEVWVYEQPDERGAGNLYVHHTLMLSAFPLAVTWLDCDPTQTKAVGNYAAIGSFEPAIEIWDLDVIDAVEPIATLGGCDYEAARAAAASGSSSDKKKKKKKGKKSGVPDVPVKPGSHTDAVLGLAWNREYRNVLASCSADKTVKVWDVSTQQCSQTLTHHKDKVQALAWNPVEASVLLSGGFDQRAVLTDNRTPDADPLVWKVSADVEALCWDPHSPTCFAIATEDGEVSCFDARGGAGSKALYKFTAHSKPATCLAFNPAVPGLLLTASTDKKVSLWTLDGSNTPSALISNDLKVGAVFSANFCRDAPLLIAAGGAKGTVSVWDTTTEEVVVEYAKSKGVAVELTELVKGSRKKRGGSEGSESDDDDDGDSDSD